ncbi:MAG: DNA replication and repair protein RecF [Gemmatimonadetes bacterium]|nr:DNA replication and repair protein RecF [Gemmatimonadota bacterium]
MAEDAPTAGVAVRLRSLALRNVRNIGAADLTWPAAGAVIVGANGHGKTNLLEAIHYAHALRPLRGGPDREVVQFDQDTFHLGYSAEGARCHTLGIGAERGSRAKRVVMDGAPVARLADAFAAIPSVVLSPRDAELVQGAPRERRHFLDALLAATSPRYLEALQRYRHALAQRSVVLRGPSTSSQGTEASVWEGPLATAGAVLWVMRRDWTSAWAKTFTQYCAEMGETAAANMRHHTGQGDALEHEEANLVEHLRGSLAAGREDDVRRGMTQVGPHRDDVRLLHGGRSVRAFASAGQQRTMALALRLIAWETLCASLARRPILLLDDPFAELDRSRVERILAMLRRMEGVQRILVVPRADEVPPDFTPLERWTIREGVIDGGQ